MLLLSVACNPYAAAHAIAALGADGFTTLDEDQRNALFQAVPRIPSAAARAIAGLGAAGLTMLNEEQRNALFQSIVRSPAAADQTALTVGDSLSEPERRALRSALLGSDATLAIPHAIAQGATWRPWMSAFAPDIDADDAVRAAWILFARHLPQHRAVALLVKRTRRQ